MELVGLIFRKSNEFLGGNGVLIDLMKTFTRLFVLVVALNFTSSAFAREKNALTRTVAAKIISEANQVRNNEVNIGPMQKVDRKLDKSTTAKEGVCVTFIAPVIKNGGRRREVQTRTFFWDNEWGWYLYAIETVRGGEAIEVVSELKGRFEMR